MTAYEQELAGWIRLVRTPGVGPETARRLLSALGPPENIFTAGHAALSELIPERLVHALLAPLSDDTAALIARTCEWAEQPGNRVLTLADADYPADLLDIPDPPLMLYVKGRLELLRRRSIAIVGSRNATLQGARNASQFAEALSHAGLTIVSGLALGIDAAAHQGALQAAGLADAGSTVAVIGTGIDIVYPARNRELAHRIAEQGCLISEYALGTPAIAANFPRRNRLISGLARGVLVVEAAAQSGSLITARTALEQGRDVFAIPGSIHSPLSKGCHLLIKQGAKLVESASDILEELSPPLTAHAIQARSAHEDSLRAHPLLACMGFDPIDIDLLAERTQMDVGALQAQLLALELAGDIEMLPGGSCRRLHQVHS